MYIIQTLVIALGAGLWIWGTINMIGGYCNKDEEEFRNGKMQFLISIIVLIMSDLVG